MRWRGTRTMHPAVPELQEQLRTGHLDRREFLRTVTLLGVTARAAYAMVGRLTGQPMVPRARAAGKMGGNLRCSMRVQPMFASRMKFGLNTYVVAPVKLKVLPVPVPAFEPAVEMAGPPTAPNISGLIMS